MTKEHDFGNRITANALGADDGKELVVRAWEYVRSKYDLVPCDEAALFTGVYYDAAKVGSVIARAKNGEGETFVVKFQLRQLPFDEGSIIRSVEANLRADRIRAVKIVHDAAWSAELGFGYLIFEDLSHLPNLWSNAPTNANDRALHKQFIDAFSQSALPIAQPWVARPTATLQEKVLEAFGHFQRIAQQSAHHHISEEELAPFVDQYLSVVRSEKSWPELVFTHGHLSGFDVKVDESARQFILMANLYWSWRPKQYELVFPVWVDLMQIPDASLTFDVFFARVMAWHDLWAIDEADEHAFWLMLFDRAFGTIMLDLGASEWKKDEVAQKQALLECWKELFTWILKEKL